MSRVLAGDVSLVELDGRVLFSFLGGSEVGDDVSSFALLGRVVVDLAWSSVVFLEGV